MIVCFGVKRTKITLRVCQFFSSVEESLKVIDPSVLLLPVHDNFFLTFEAFDVRMGNSGKRGRVFKFYEHEGEMTDFSGDSARRLLFASSTDSTMSTIDFRRTQYKMQRCISPYFHNLFCCRQWS